jgi:hypothetical protein
MKKSVLLITLIAVFASTAFTQNKAEEVKAIKEVIQSAYVEGLQNEGDAAKIDAGFHPDFDLLIPEGDQLKRYAIKDWKKNTMKKREAGKLPLPKDRQVSVTFEFVDVEGTAATAKIKFLVGKDLRYIDYISLYKFGENWKIVSKIFHEIK